MAANSREQVFFEDDGESFRKGDEFEKYTLTIFPAMYYVCLERTHVSRTNEERFIESSLKPDFKFRDKKTKKREFFVESKYRGMSIDNRILWTDAKQFQRYPEYNKDCPVFILIGFKGRPSDPVYLYLIPLAKIKYVGLFPSMIKDFLLESKLITTQDLWSRIG